MTPLERSTHDRQALADCIRAGIEAKDGRATWRPIAAAADGMVKRGCCGALATKTARAAQAVGVHLRRLILKAGFSA